MFKHTNMITSNSQLSAFASKYLEFHKCDFSGLIVPLEQKFDSLQRGNKGSYGDMAVLPMNNGKYLCFKFTDCGTYIYVKPDNKHKKDPVVSLLDGRSTEQDNKKISEIIAKEFAKENAEIGSRYTPSFAKTLKKLKPGAIVTYNTGYSFVVLENAADKLKISEIHNVGKIEDIDINDFISKKDLIVNTDSPEDIQHLYTLSENKYTYTSIQRIASVETTDNKIKEMKKNVKLFSSEAFHIGKIKFMLTHNMHGYRWMSDGVKVNEEQIRNIIAWASTSPAEINIEHKDSNNDEIYAEAYDQDFLQMALRIASEKKYYDLADAICDECRNRQNVIIHVHSLKESGINKKIPDIEDTEFIFENNGMEITVKEVILDSNGLPDIVNDINAKQFIKEIEEKEHKNTILFEQWTNTNLMKPDMVKKVPAEKAERFKKLEMEAIQKKYPLIDKNSFEIFTEATEKFSQADDMSKTRKRHDGPSLDEI